MKLFMQLSIKTLMMVFVLFAVACGDDDSQEPNDSPLIGTWKWTINERLNCEGDEGLFDVYDCTEFCYDIEFKNDGIAIITVQDDGITQTGTGTYTLSGSDFTLCVTENDIEFCESGKLTISGDTYIWFVEAEDDTVCDVNRTHLRENN